ncbi:hypothetical protein MNBD_GAMMA05-1502 [hydrothermal vent metagenome]|uniref:Uncharacterized protein n=1 Tax=hydrothermal vent metagenome TaxID=652676 RepID=A0A3B0X4L6_9ZZZZ
MKKGFDRLRDIAAASAMGLGMLGGGSARAAIATFGITTTTAGVKWQGINTGSVLASGQSFLITESGISFPSISAFAMLINNASLTSGIANAFDGALFMATLQSGVTKRFDNPDGTVDLTGNTLTSDLQTDFLTGIDAQIEYYFHPVRPLVRALYSFENTTGGEITFQVYIGGNLQSKNATNIQSTSNNDTNVEASDLWIISSNKSLGTDPTTGTTDTPVITISRFGTGAVEPKNGVQLANGAGTFGHLYDVTIPKSSTRRILVFAELNSSIDNAKIAATDFETLEAAELAGLLTEFISNDITLDEIINYTEDTSNNSNNGSSSTDNDGDLSTGTLSTPAIAMLLGLLTLSRVRKKENI